MNYILDGHILIEEPDIKKWVTWLQTTDRIVERTKIGDSTISTVFLGIDHSFDGTPSVFETLVFEGELAGEICRYATWKEAEQGHREMVKKVKMLLFNENIFEL